MLSLKTHALLSGSLFAAIVIFAVVGNVLHDSGMLANGRAVQMAARIVFFALFLMFGFSMIPLMVKLVLHGQVAIGNANVGLVRTLQNRQGTVVLVFWGLIASGLALAIPAAIEDGFFGTDPAADFIARTPSRGTLVARPGMSVEEMERRSSLALKGKPDTVIADGTLFDFQVADTGISFPRCRYYYITTGNNDRSIIANISVGTAQSKMTRVQLAAADAELRERLAADGWLTGYERTRSDAQRRFHGGAAGARSGLVWMKGDTMLRIMSRRLDDSKPGEDAAKAGDWIQFVELSSRQNYSGLEFYEFAKPQPGQ